MDVNEEVIMRYIERDPRHHGPADARLVRFNVPVWAIIGYWRVVNEDAERVARDYDLPLRAVQAAVAYYCRHKDVIDARIEANTVCVA